MRSCQWSAVDGSMREARVHFVQISVRGNVVDLPRLRINDESANIGVESQMIANRVIGMDRIAPLGWNPHDPCSAEWERQSQEDLFKVGMSELGVDDVVEHLFVRPRGSAIMERVFRTRFGGHCYGVPLLRQAGDYLERLGKPVRVE